MCAISRVLNVCFTAWSLYSLYMYIIYVHLCAHTYVPIYVVCSRYRLWKQEAQNSQMGH